MFKLLLFCMCLRYAFSWAQQENGSILELIKKLAAKIDDVEENTKTLNAKLTGALTKVDIRLEKNEKSLANLNDKIEELKHLKKREFKFVETPQTWGQAEETCKKWGGHLLTIRSKIEQDYFVKEINKRHWSTWTVSWTALGVWIGLNDQKEEGKFAWVGNEESFYYDWSQGEPNGGRGENCVHMLMNGSANRAWNDIVCNGGWRFHSICERHR